MFKLNLIGLFLIVFSVQLWAGSYEVYSQGKILESTSLLRDELQSSKLIFSVTQLSSAMKRLLSSYEVELKISDVLVMEILRLIKNKKNVDEMEYEIKDYIEALQFFIENKPSFARVDTYLKDVIAVSKGAKRFAVYAMIKIYSKRSYLLSVASGQSDPRWLYLAGKAGFYNYNNGLDELNEFIDFCTSSKSSFCRAHLKEASELEKIGADIKF